ncbi:MAG: hypothetical protein ABSE47_03005 [Acidimicrobiales bacterium]
MTIVDRKKGRRPAGDGSVYEAPDGRWRGAVDLGWVDGKRRRVAAYRHRWNIGNDDRPLGADPDISPAA